MKSSRVRVPPLACMLAVVLASTGSVEARKPSAPIELKARALGVVTPGVPVTVEVVARALVDAPRMTVELRLPSGVQHRSGALTFEGAVNRGGTAAVSPAIQVSTSERKVVLAVASIRFADGRSAVASCVVALEPPGSRKPSAPGRLRLVPGGARVVEHAGVER